MPEPQTQDFVPTPEPDASRELENFLSLDGSLGEGAPAVNVEATAVTHLAQQRFTVLRGHAQGGLGKVSIARDEKLKREVAFKEIRPDRLSPQARKRFLTEAEITGQLEHPGIVPVYSLQEDASGKPSYTMRFIQGRTLDEAIKAYHAAPDPLAFHDLLQRFIAVCKTVAYAHSKGIIHRDLKPANIMLGEYGETLVLDWGLAKRTGEQGRMPEDAAGSANAPAEEPTTPGTSGSTQLVVQGETPDTQQGEVLGTPAFMAPEQARGEIDQLGPATDVYALGVILYQLLTNQLPYQGSMFDILVQVKEGIAPPSPAAVQRAAPKPLAAACLKAMSPGMTDRYASAVDLAKEIERYLADEPVSAHAEPLAVRARRWLRRHRVVAASIVVGLTVAVPLLTIGLFVIDSFRRSETTAKDNALRAKDDALLAENRAREVILTMTSEVQLEAMGRQPKLTADQEKLLRLLAVWYREMAQKAGETEKELDQQVVFYLRLGHVLDMLGQKGEALNIYDHAAKASACLSAAHPSEPEYQSHQSLALANLSLMQDATGQHAEALANCREAIRLREKLATAQPRHRIDQARLVSQLANLQERQGQYAEAEAAYGQARQLLDQLPASLDQSVAAQTVLSQVLCNRGHQQMRLARVQPTEETLQKARQLLEKLIAAEPGYHEHQGRLADTLTNLGCLQANTGRAKEAQASFLKALDLRQKLCTAHPSVTSFQFHLAVVWKFLGAIQNVTGQQKEAEASCHEARQLLERLRAADPGVLTYTAQLAEVYYNLGLAHFATGRYQDTETNWQQSLRAREQLATAYPDVPDHLLALASMHNGLGSLQQRTGRLVEAEASTEKACRVGKQLVARFPKVLDYQTTLVHAMNNLGVIQAERKLPEKARATYDEARQLGEKLVAHSPNSPRYQLLLANTLQRLGTLQRDTGQRKEADESYRQACQLGEKLVAAHPTVTEYQMSLADATCDLAASLRVQERYKEALPHYDRTQAVLEQILRREPKHPDARNCLYFCWHGRAIALDGLGRHAAAIVCWDKALACANAAQRKAVSKGRQQALAQSLTQATLQARFGFHVPAAQTVELLHPLTNLEANDRLQFVRILAQCIGTSGTWYGSAPTNTERERYLQRALEQLRKLQAMGFFQEPKNLEMLQTDPAFAPLRQQAGFAKFLEELGK